MKRYWAALTVALSVSTIASAADRELELTFLRPVIAANLLDYSHVEVLGLDSIEVRQEANRDFVELRIFKGQALLNSGTRAELSIDYPFRTGETVTYEWDFRIDADFQSDAPENRWWYFGQLHDQPNLNIDEVWRGFPDRSPPIALAYGVLDGNDILALNYGAPNSRQIGTAVFSREQWHHIKMQVHWSMTGDGWINVYFDNSPTPFASAQGRNMHNNYQHYLKLGMYRQKDIRADSNIQIDNVTIVTTHN